MDMDNSVDYERYNIFCKNNCPLICKNTIRRTEKCPIVLFENMLNDKRLQ